MESLDLAIQELGSQQKLAAAIGVGQSHISMWKVRKRVPAEYCPAIERATNRKVRCEQLRPDVPWAVLREQVA